LFYPKKEFNCADKKLFYCISDSGWLLSPVLINNSS